MPNIIEQQDLLKGLPDARLAMLLQKPVADIPPFLVAAEAQRRQAIRQQFAGSAPKESVVDSLTKQLANVPQNIQAPKQTPQQIPPTPQMQGVMALQQQQQAAQQPTPQQPQQIKAGGMVQRYYDGGKVEPMWRLPDYSGVIPRVMDWVGSTAESLARPYSEMEAEDKLRAIEDEKRNPAEVFRTGMSAEDRRVSGKMPPPAMPAPPPREEGDKTPETITEKDAIRARLEALYGDQEPSDWEKAQRWFAMSEQFLDPSKTTMQSVAGAGQAFASAAAEQDRAAREGRLARDKGLLEYDIAKLDEAERRRVADQQAKADAIKAQTGVATGQLDDLRRERRDIAERIRKIQSDAALSGLGEDEAVKSQISTLQNLYDDLGNQISSYERFISDTYGFSKFPTADIGAGKINPPRP